MRWQELETLLDSRNITQHIIAGPSTQCSSGPIMVVYTWPAKTLHIGILLVEHLLLGMLFVKCYMYREFPHLAYKDFVFQ